MKVVVFGAAGQLGSSLCELLGGLGTHVRGLTRQDVDLTNYAGVGQVLSNSRPDVVVNCAAYHNLAACEAHPEMAYGVNTFAVANLALACHRNGARCVHVSTDYVFDGEKGSPYVESDPPHALQAYGRSKQAGEYTVMAASRGNLIVRTASLFGAGGISSKGGDFPRKILAAAKQHGNVHVRTDLTMSPTYIPDLARGIAAAIYAKQAGILHLAGGEPATWFEVALEFVRAAGLSAIVEPVDPGTDTIVRPKNSALASEHGFRLPSWKTRIRPYLDLIGG